MTQADSKIDLQRDASRLSPDGRCEVYIYIVAQRHLNGFGVLAVVVMIIGRPLLAADMSVRQLSRERCGVR